MSSSERIGIHEGISGSYEKIFSPGEIRSLLYFQGAVENIVLGKNEEHLRKLYSIGNAYEALNMLLFDDIGCEQARLWEEKREIDEGILDNMPELLEVYCNLYSAICKYTYLLQKESTYTYRDDRYYNCIHMNSHGFNESFLSSTLNPEKSEDPFQKKDRLTFLEFQAQTGAEWLNVNEVLGEKSKYPEEKEILFSPFQNIELRKMEMTEKEKTILGNNYTPPHGKYLVIVKKSAISPMVSTVKDKEEMKSLKKLVLDAGSIENAKIVWRQIRKNEYDLCNVKHYLEWKKNLQLYIRKCYAAIKWDVLNLKGRQALFEYDLEQKVDAANEKREKYEKGLWFFHITEIIIGVIAGIYLTMDVKELYSGNFRVRAIILFGILFILAGICRALSVSEKLQQNTDIFLRYDELREKWRYEKLKDTDMLDQYTERMIETSILNNQYCWQYTDNAVKYKESWEEKMRKMSEINE